MIKNRIGTFLEIAGIILLISSLGLLLFNNLQSKKAEEASNMLLPQVKDIILETADVKEEVKEEEEPEEIFIDGCGYIGYLTLPSLNEELPVMSSWDYEKLKAAPCRQFGSLLTDDLVVAAHNYKGHFGNLHLLKPEDSVIMTDTQGKKYFYKVSNLTTIPADAVKEVEESDYELILYTCTYDGVKRIAAMCERVYPEEGKESI